MIPAISDRTWLLLVRQLCGITNLLPKDAVLCHNT